MTFVKSVTLEVSDPSAARSFYTTAFGVDVDVRASDAESTGFRAYTMSLVVSQPSTVDSLIGGALDCGATTLKSADKSFWGYGGVVRAPDGAIWKVSTSSKKDTSPTDRRIDDVVLLIGVADVKASKRFYVENGLTVAKSFGGKYVQFEAAPNRIKLALYPRRALAKDAGVAPEGTGSHRIVIGSDAEPFTDPDGFVWETDSALVRRAVN